MNKKPFNKNYLCDSQHDRIELNEKNRPYIDRFISENYNSLVARFSLTGETINSSAYGSLDILNSTIVSLYTDPDLKFSSQEEANRCLSNKFKCKSVRDHVKKPVDRELCE